MNFLRENEADFECSFDCNNNAEMQSILGYFIRKLGGGGRNGVNVHVVSWITCQTDKQEKNIKFWVLRWTKSKIIKKFSFLFKVKRYDEPRKGINWMEIISVHFFTNVISKTAKTFVSQKQWLWLRRDEREQQNELSSIHYEMR